MQRRRAAEDAGDGKPDPRGGGRDALRDDAVFCDASGQRAGERGGEEVRATGREPARGAGAHFGCEGKGADAGQIQRGVSKSLHTRC